MKKITLLYILSTSLLMISGCSFNSNSSILDTSFKTTDFAIRYGANRTNNLQRRIKSSIDNEVFEGLGSDLNYKNNEGDYEYFNLINENGETIEPYKNLVYLKQHGSTVYLITSTRPLEYLGFASRERLFQESMPNYYLNGDNVRAFEDRQYLMINQKSGITYDVFGLYEYLMNGESRSEIANGTINFTGNGIAFLFNNCTINFYFDDLGKLQTHQFCFDRPMSNFYFVSNTGKSLLSDINDYMDSKNTNYTIYDYQKNQITNPNAFLENFSDYMFNRDFNQSSFRPVYYNDSFVYYLDNQKLKIFTHDFEYVKEVEITNESIQYINDSGFSIDGGLRIGSWNDTLIKSAGTEGIFLFDFTNFTFQFINIELYYQFIKGDYVYLFDPSGNIAIFDLHTKTTEYYETYLFSNSLYENSFNEDRSHINFFYRAIRTGYIFYHTDLNRNTIHAFNVHDKNIYSDLANLPVNEYLEKSFIQ